MLALACSARRRPASEEVSISECDVTWRTVQGGSLLLFSKLCVHKQCSQCWCSCVETLVIVPAKFHVVSSLVSVLKIAILMLS